MNSIILWFLSTAFDSFWTSHWKKALDNSKISKTLFAFFWNIWWFFFILFLVFFIWIKTEIFSNYLDLFLIISIISADTLNGYLRLHILTNTKLSEILPYQNIDKLFIVIIWFFIFAWTDKQTSLTTLLITILTVFIIIFLTIDFKNIKIPKSIWYIFINKFANAILILATWYMLIKYSSATFWIFNWLVNFIILSWIIFFSKSQMWDIYSQNKSFYLSRLIAVIFWWTSWLIWLYIIESAWVIIASLLGFLSIVFSIFSMKFVLKDNPTKKQISLAFIVIFMIWTWYYFK